MKTTLDIQHMSRAEKLQTMESIWDALSRSTPEVEAPAWHEHALKETEARVAAGQERIADWETAKQELRKRFA